MLGALKASLRSGDLVAAGHYQRIIDEYFGADEVNAADPADVSGEEAEDAAAGRSDSGTPATEDRGVAGMAHMASGVRTSASSSQSEDEPTTHCGTQISANADSQVTVIDDGEDRSSDDDAASGRARPALDYYSVFRSA